jgi:hypothetical protein
VLGNKQIYNSNCIQQFNYGTEEGYEKKSSTRKQTLMLENEKSFAVRKRS